TTEVARWRQLGAVEPDLQIAVNVSGAQLADPDLLGLVEQVVAGSALPSHLLCIEVTETLLGEESHTPSALQALRARGVTVSLDDFGTGHSSLWRLNSLPVDEIKIDRRFVSALPADACSRAIVESVSHIARTIGISVVAEGVETVEQASCLSELGVHDAQGYLWARPLEADAFLAYAAEHRRLARGPATGPRASHAPEAVIAAMRNLYEIEQPEDAIEILQQVVRDLGGVLVTSVADGDVIRSSDSGLAVDVSL
ncbi:hypothetical protein B7486_67435, partial [cyanobacterium TDX16]